MAQLMEFIEELKKNSALRNPPPLTINCCDMHHIV